MDASWCIKYSTLEPVHSTMTAHEGGQIIAGVIIGMLALKGLCDIL